MRFQHEGGGFIESWKLSESGRQGRGSCTLVLALRLAFAALLRRRGGRSRRAVAVGTCGGQQLFLDGVEAGRGGSGRFVAHHFGELGVVDLRGGC